ncbi:MAG: DUF1987 domain-containing protein [Bacteroidales bacterium]|nr:DUF1987 domain-containing protein [Bacteroidales bacterium]HOK98355.1 DUF1987 domain-containing protein [Bacteroidales bacterium]HPO65222.1 DUF1987 domain-containing protein [Bacteroidales bacterium]
MESLYINNYPDLVYYPLVNFNYYSGVCEIVGESYMEETLKFYEPVIRWLKDYMQEKKPIEFNLKLTYFNTASSRFILEILDLLKSYQDNGGQVKVNWYYKREDPDMLMEIQGFEAETGLKITPIIFD